MAKSFLDTLSKEFVKGLGRGTGYNLSRSTTDYAKSKILNDKTTFRRMMDNFVLPGTFKAGHAKLIILIERFENEYTSTKTLLQTTWYLESDKKSIERELQYLDRRISSEFEERQFTKLSLYWEETKIKF